MLMFFLKHAEVFHAFVPVFFNVHNLYNSRHKLSTSSSVTAAVSEIRNREVPSGIVGGRTGST